MKTFYRLWVTDNDIPTRFAMMHDSREYLQDRGEEWLRLGFIKSFYITEHTEK